jgi:hypothetical protein|tara:strand:- start:11465 stop:13153 length:1689 start_codon:yes stop_codon:yes gene_type:complete
MARVATLPYELLISGFILLAVSYIIGNFNRVSKLFSSMSSKKKALFSFGLVMFLVVVIGTFLLFFQRIEGQDEGIHINSAKLAYEGQMPYVDFIYLKDPLFTYVAGFPLLFLGFDLYGGRIAALLIKLLMFYLVFSVTKRLTKSEWYGVLATSLLAFHLMYQGSTATLDTSSTIPVLFLLFGLHSLTWKIPNSKKAIASTLLFSASIATRAFAAPAILFLLWYLWKLKSGIKNLLLSLITGIGFLLVVYLPFFAADFQKTFFGFAGAPLTRSAIFPAERTVNYFLFEITQGTLSSAVFDKLFVLSLTIFYNFIIYGTIAITAFALFRSGRVKWSSEDRKMYILLFGVFVAITAVSSLVPTPASYSYSLSFLPLGAIVASVGLKHLLHNYPREKLLAIAGVLIILTVSFSLLQYPRFRLDYSEDGSLRFPVNEVSEVADFVRLNTAEESKIITFEIPIALEADRAVIHGFERGYFGFFLFDSDKARSVNGMNSEIYAEHLESRDASAVVMSQRKTDKFFELIPLEDSALIMEALSENYYLAKTFDQVTDWGSVRVYLPLERQE